ncbi:M48 family metalloprotease [Flavihumibacter rivuli]|uniref:M56 family metallopeptidase n=1 Tax=Flavihumibacter rivuli TaxID=2838156 RepID=UPI001BDE2719|nr:M56 family metallopeptidase [Flavihumibacter rivuli]ULQ57904.1 M48 family metalloprotease [Flavihumibacter rivuli]
MLHPGNAAVLEALGWTLLNSWWQFGILWLGFSVVVRILPSLAASRKYQLALLALGLGSLWVFISFLFRWAELTTSTYYPLTVEDNSTFNYYSSIRSLLDQVLPWAALAYLGWLLFQFARLGGIWLQMRRLQQSAYAKVPVEWRLFVQEMQGHMHIARKISIGLTEKFDSPLVMGWLKPMILLPVASLNQLTKDQLEAILIHEMAHIKRNDYFWNLLVALAEVLFRFNPFACKLIQEIRAEREHSCDDWVLQFPFSPANYAEALLRLEQNRQFRPALLIAASGSHHQLLLTRVQRMLGIHTPAKPERAKAASLSLSMLLFMMLTLVQPELKVAELLVKNINSPAIAKGLEASYPVIREDKKPLRQVPPRRRRNDQASRQGSTVTEISTPEKPGLGKNLEEVLKVAAYFDGGNDQHFFTRTANEETRVFSLVTPGSPQLPEEASQAMQPYVPTKSFEFILTDTASPEQRHARARMKHAEEASLQAKLALEQLNLDKLARELKKQGVDEEVLKRELEKAMAQVDWKQIEKETQKMMEENRIRQVEAQLIHTRELQKQYQLQKQQLKELEQQLQWQEQHYKEMIEQQKEEIQNKQKAIQSKKKVVHI